VEGHPPSVVIEERALDDLLDGIDVEPKARKMPPTGSQTH